jgi:formylglycine-generating enzyme required for sulfatase activity
MLVGPIASIMEKHRFMPIPPLDQIAQKLFDKELILFVGSGMSAGCYPTWGKLLEELINEHLSKDRKAKAEAKQMLKDKQYLNAAWVIQCREEKDFQTKLAARFRKREHAEVEARYNLLNGLPFRAIFTTNYDHFLNNLKDRSCVTQADDLGTVFSEGRVLKLHGDQTRPETMVLTSTDYTVAKFLPQLAHIMETAATAYSFLFIGYSMGDEDVLLWLERSCFLAGRTPGPRHFALVDPSEWKDQRRKLYEKRYSVQIVDAPMAANGYPDIPAFLSALTTEYQGLVASPVKARFRRLREWPDRDLYIDPAVRKTTDDPEKIPPHSLDAHIDDWLKDDSRPFLVILGEFGVGKTWSTYRIHDKTLALTGRAPVLIRLGEFRTGADAAKVAETVFGDKDKFLEANRRGDLVVILDAFDEMGKDPNKKLTLDQTFERLRELVVDKAKVILTCRTEFFRDDDQRDKSLDKVAATGVEKIEVQLFDPPRIQRALETRQRPEIFTQIQGHARLLDLASRPVLLNLITEYQGDFDDNTRLVDLYEDYIPQLLARGANNRLHGQRRKFAEKLAWEIQQSGAGSVPVEDVERWGRELFQDEFDQNSDLYRGKTLLVRHERSNLTFGHASFREYLVAKQILPYLQRGEYKACKLSEPTIQFLREMWTMPPQPPVEKDGMVLIPKGPFICGEGDTARIENLDHDVWIDKHPVTNADFVAFLDSGAKLSKKWFKNEKKIRDKKFARHPVVDVSWHGAAAYSEWKGKRLPTDNEWEKAARGTDGRAFPWSDSFDEKRCNTSEAGPGSTTPVEQYPGDESPYGCLGMAGNVYDWTEERGVRGGSWYFNSNSALCAIRVNYGPGFHDFGLGFRCSRTSS